jgi:hypothetical protein
LARIAGRSGPDPIAEGEVNLRHKLLDAILLLIALIGGVVVWQTGREQGRLRAKIEQMTRTTGDFPITDPPKIHVLALDTGEPLHFAWRIYLPADYELVERRKDVPAPVPQPASPPGSTPSRELILRVRFREDAEGHLNLYQVHEHSSSRGSFGEESLTKVLHGRFDKVHVEQLGKPGLATVGVREPLDLLRLKLPADMEAEILEGTSPDERANYDPYFFEYCFGPDPKQPPTPGGGN